MSTELSRGYRTAKQITDHHARSFYFCSLLLDRSKRPGTYCVYALLRNIDDDFDTGTPSRTLLNDWNNRIRTLYDDTAPQDDLFYAIKTTIHKYNIPEKYFIDLLKGMEMDIVGTDYENFDDLYKYCYRVAGVVGKMMLHIFGYTSDKALGYAEKMGVAMQLTNILRDINEDLLMDRIYLPSSELSAYNIKKEDLTRGTLNENFYRFMQFQISRARSYYMEGFQGIHLIADENAAFIAKLMGNIYMGILDAIEANDHDIFSNRAYVPFTGKLGILFKTLTGKI